MAFVVAATRQRRRQANSQTPLRRLPVGGTGLRASSGSGDAPGRRREKRIRSGLEGRQTGDSTEKPTPNDVVTVQYTGWSSDGRMFDSTLSRNAPSTFPLNRAMAGWKECVGLMALHETRRCWVPESLSWKGQAGRPKGTVVFDIELLDTRLSPTIAPPDVKEPPADAKKTPGGVAYKVLRPGTGTPSSHRLQQGDGPLLGLDDGRQAVRQFGRARNARRPWTWAAA